MNRIYHQKLQDAVGRMIECGASDAEVDEFTSCQQREFEQYRIAELATLRGWLEREGETLQ